METAQGQRLPTSLTPLDAALAALLHGLAPVAPVALPLAEALNCIVASSPPARAYPAHDIAVSDGWALRANDLVGASSYSPVPLVQSPVWVEAGDAMPECCDCVIDADSVDHTGPIVQVLAEAIPGQGVRRAGGDLSEGSLIIAKGRRAGSLDLLVARAAGITTFDVCRPRLRVVNIPSSSDRAMTARLIAESARAHGAEVTEVAVRGRDAASIVTSLDGQKCDLLITIGGSGVGRTDATIAALAQCGEVIAHGIALQPGRTCAIGRIADIPVIALPGAADQALAGWWALALPALERLSGGLSRQPVSLPLARKVASSVGVAEIVLLQRAGDAWMPLAVGDLTLEIITRADAWLVVAGDAEGFAAGTPVGAYMMRQ
jgi:molybdopterin molybdotransferase